MSILIKSKYIIMYSIVVGFFVFFSKLDIIILSYIHILLDRVKKKYLKRVLYSKLLGATEKL